MVSRVNRFVPWMIGVAIAAAANAAQAQSNLDAGKSPAQIFSNTCNACHRSARELRPTSAGFLREHYTTGAQEAASMAAYLASVGSDPRAVQQRRPPTLGAGQAATTTEGTPRPPQAMPGGEQGRPQEGRPQEGRPQEGQATLPGRRPPSEQSKQSPATAALKPRRPSESMEAGRLSDGGDLAPVPAAAAPKPAPHQDFEE
ncbi:MAG TPA: hypothetical protein VKD43_03405 [Xanthobacteraceae bacterium]|nr:hypothetical protein [Xanthobacteraceae bacterium]